MFFLGDWSGFLVYYRGLFNKFFEIIIGNFMEWRRLYLLEIVLECGRYDERNIVESFSDELMEEFCVFLLKKSMLE